MALPNTHDSFYFGSIVQKAALGMHQNNDLLPGVYKNGMITALPYWLIKLFPELSIEHLLLWLPVYIAGLVCIPLVLIGRLYHCTLWGLGRLASPELPTVITIEPWRVIMIRIFLQLHHPRFRSFFYWQQPESSRSAICLRHRSLCSWANFSIVPSSQLLVPSAWDLWAIKSDYLF